LLGGGLMTSIATAPKSLVQTAIDAVSQHMRESNMRVGDTLPGEGYFAERLGVSRAVMREAFQALAALKLIDVANGRKPRVGALDGSVIATSLAHALSTAQIKVVDVWDVRRTIEVRTAMLAAANASAAQADRIVDLAEKLEAEDEADDHTTDTDIAFHLAIAEASGNELFHQIVISFVPLMKVAIPQAWGTRQTSDQRRDSVDRHRKLAKAIKSRDVEGAGQWMSAHFDETVGIMLRGNG